MSNQNKTLITVGCPGILGVLTVIFVIAKILQLGDIATWSWWIVLSPLWGPFALFFGSLALIAILVGAAYTFLKIYTLITKK